MSEVPIQTPFQNLSIMAVVFSALSSLFGVYMVLFVIAVWSTYRQKGPAYTRLRLVTIVLFLVLCAHYSARALTFARARVEHPGLTEESQWTVPLIFVGAITSTLSGFISDGFVAWRFYVIYGNRPWALYLPAIAVTVTALLGFSGAFQQLAIFRSVELYNDRIAMVALDVNAAWGWCMFAVNTILTGSIIGKIIYIDRHADASKNAGVECQQYPLILKAIVESAAVTWLGLLLYEIATLAPTGGITANFDIGYVMVCITPIFFGISQCLITVLRTLSATSEREFGGISCESNASSASHALGMTFKEGSNDAVNGLNLRIFDSRLRN